MIQFDAKNSRLSDAMFAEAYRATIPTLADVKHVTVRACGARLAEISHTDISDVVEIGTVKEKLNGVDVDVVRVVAAPVSVHVGEGARVIEDDDFDKHVVSFEVNGAPAVQIVNLALSATELKAEQATAAAQAKLVADNNDKALQAKIETARQQGREEALLEAAKKEGAASVQNKSKLAGN